MDGVVLKIAAAGIITTHRRYSSDRNWLPEGRQ